MQHQTVLLEEAVTALAVKENGTYVDATFGRGGHSRAILSQLGPKGRLIAIDRDPDAIETARATLGLDPRCEVVHASFARWADVCEQLGLTGKIDGLLMDLGVSSPQLDDAERGFSFLRDGPLDMRMDPSQGESAATWLARVDEAELSRVLWEYGEERFSRKIARAIVRFREEHGPIERTSQLAALIDETVPRKEPGKHPATRSFQAIRIHINRELDEIRQALDGVPDALAPGGRLVVISFHSLEDRIVKRFMRSASKGPVLPRHLPVTGEQLGPMQLVSKPVRPSREEIQNNPRARSAVMRVAEKRRLAS